MVNRSKAKGTSFESSLLPLLREYFPGAERRALSGAKDKGDFILPGANYALEAKNQKGTMLGPWHKEAKVEAENLGVAFGVVVHKRHGMTDPAEQWVCLTLRDFLELTKQ